MSDPNSSKFAYEYPLLIKQILISGISTNSNQEIISGKKQKFNYIDLKNRITRLASGLTNLGVKFGDTVAVMDWDCHRYLECFFAIPMIGAVLHTVNIRLSNQEILYTINNAEDDVILINLDFIPVIEKIYNQIEKPVKFILISDEQHEIKKFNHFEIISDYETLINNSDLNFKFKDFDEKTIATRFYTTGTTGNPKGVSYSHRQIVLHTMGVIAGVGTSKSESRFHREDVYMPITPMFHVHGWGFPYVATLLGLKQVYPGKYETGLLLELINKEGVTFSHCVPTILNMLLQSPLSKNIDLSNLKMIIGGSAMPKSLAKLASERGINIFSAYGLSETCPFLTVADIPFENNHLNDDEIIDLRCKTGKAAPFVELKVVDNEMNEMAKDGKSTGEVVVRAPWLTQGYVKNSEASDELWRNGYLHTGDVGYIDKNGSLQITDRMKDVIKSGGEWISSLELEDIILKCKGIKEVAVIGIPDEKWGERPIIIVSCDEGINTNQLEKNIENSLDDKIKAGKLNKWAKPDRIEYVNEIKKTSVGKIDKKSLRLQFA